MLRYNGDSMKGILSTIAEFLFPKRCVYCKSYGDGLLCQRCFESIPLDTHNADDNDRVILALYQLTPVLHVLLSSYKFDRQTALLPEISKLIDAFPFEKVPIFSRVDAVCFVPLTKKRKATRGFNQSERIAQLIADRLHVPCVSLLSKVCETPPQSSLGRNERQHNIEGKIEAVAAISYGTVLIVDDIVTTGATLLECVRVLAYRKVTAYGLALGRTRE